MKNKGKTTKALKAEIGKLKAAYKTVADEDANLAEMIAALELILGGFKDGTRLLARELRTRVRNIVKLVAAGEDATEERELIPMFRANLIELAGKIADVELSLHFHRAWSKVKP